MSQSNSCRPYGTLGGYSLSIAHRRSPSDDLFSDNILSDNEHRLGWKPKWNKDRFLQNIGDEVQAVLDHGKAKSSLIDSLFEAAKE